MDNIETLKNIKMHSEQGGGADKIEMQHSLDKLTARERIEVLLDEGSFIEIGTLTGGNASGVVTGYGTSSGRLVYVFSQDYTVDGGSVTSLGSKKICRIMDMALKMGAPIVGIYDSAGGKLSEGLELLNSFGSIIRKNAELSGVVPQIAVILGSCTGAAAISASMCDFTIISEAKGELYINSPEKVAAKEERYIEKDAFVSAVANSKNGTALLTAEDDKEALEFVKILLNYLPSNNIELAPLGNTVELSSVESRLDELSKEENYDIYEIISLISDAESFIELNVNYGREVLTGFTRLNGITTGVIACDKIENSEGLGLNAIEKLTRFTKLCSAFNIPLISLVDTKGFKVSEEEEAQGLSLWASKLVYTLAQAKVPKIALIIGEAYGSAFITLASKDTTFDITYAWPSAKISLGEPEWVIKAMYREEILNSDNPKMAEQEVVKVHKDQISSPYSAAELGYIDDVILPSETRIRLFACLDMLQTKREIGYPKKHGSVLI